MTDEAHFMIDLETLCNNPEDGVIMAIGAVKFQLYDGPLIECRASATLPMMNEVVSDREFYVIVNVGDSVRKGLKIEQSTFNWWLEEERRAEFHRMLAYAYAVDIDIALASLQAFIERAEPHRYGWSHGSVYDMAFMVAQFKRFAMLRQIVNPFDHHNIMDTRTLLKVHREIMGYDVVWPEPQMKHHPVDDARRQAYVVQVAARNLRDAIGRRGS